MALNEMFEIESGLKLNDSHYLSGAGEPGSGDSASVGLGSHYLDTTNGFEWVKKFSGSGVDKWYRIASENYVQTFFAGGISWREPVEVRDNTATVLPTEDPGDPIIIDGVSIENDERVLFSALTGGDGKNVYVYDQAAGTFYEDDNSETPGDTVYIKGGTDAGKTFTYNGTAWVWTNQSDQDELAYIRTFIGKNAAGSEMPDYSSVFTIADGDSLETALGKLDAEIGTDITPVTRTFQQLSATDAVKKNIDDLDALVGPDSDLTPTSRTNNPVTLNSSVYTKFDQLDAAIGIDVNPIGRTFGAISATNSVNVNIDQLDEAIGGNVSPVARSNNPITVSTSSNANIDALDAAIGTDVSGVARTIGAINASDSVNANIDQLDEAIGANVTVTQSLSTANTVNQNLSALDLMLDKERHEVAAVLNVTSLTTLDSVFVDSTMMAKWHAMAEGNLAGDEAKKEYLEITAIHNGTAAADATSLDVSKVNKLTLGNLGVAYSVDLNGTAGTQVMRLRASASIAADFRVTRRVILLSQ